MSTRSLVFQWDGELLQPITNKKGEDDGQQSSPQEEETVVSLGAGQWSGVFISWYESEWHVLKTRGRRDKFMKYFFDEQVISIDR